MKDFIIIFLALTMIIFGILSWWQNNSKITTSDIADLSITSFETGYLRGHTDCMTDTFNLEGQSLSFKEAITK